MVTVRHALALGLALAACSSSDAPAPESTPASTGATDSRTTLANEDLPGFQPVAVRWNGLDIQILTVSMRNHLDPNLRTIAVGYEVRNESDVDVALGEAARSWELRLGDASPLPGEHPDAVLPIGDSKRIDVRYGEWKRDATIDIAREAAIVLPAVGEQSQVVARLVE